MEDFNSARKRKHVWQNIQNQLIGLNIQKSAVSCERKWRNLIRTYKNIKDNRQKTGRGSRRFAYYDAMDEILGNKPSTSCAHTINVGVKKSINFKEIIDTEKKLPLNEVNFCTEDNIKMQKKATFSAASSSHADQITVVEEKDHAEETVTKKNSKKRYANPVAEYLKKKIYLEEEKFKLKKMQVENKEQIRLRKLLALEEANKIQERKTAAFEKYVEILSNPLR